MFGMKGMGDVMKLMGQAGKIQENIAQAHIRAKNRLAVGESGAGLVKVTANGVGEIVSVYVDPEVLKDLESVGPLMAAAANLALIKGKELLLEETKSAMGDIELPPGII